MKNISLVCLSCFMLFTGIAEAAKMPKEFVYLRDVDSSILQDIRYAGYHNFVGRPIPSYNANECILTKQAADALTKVQKVLQASSLSLKVYDCYRPKRAVKEFVTWSKKAKDNLMQAEFYPGMKKRNLFQKGYIAARSGHSRGSTVDLTIVSEPVFAQEVYHRGQKLVDCRAPLAERYKDNSLDMGTGFDCFDPLSHALDKKVGAVPYSNRLLLRQVMSENGFEPYGKEWWHFTLNSEPFPKTYFDFPINPNS